MNKLLLTLAIAILSAAPAAAAQRSGQDPSKLPLAGGTLSGSVNVFVAGTNPFGLFVSSSASTPSTNNSPIYLAWDPVGLDGILGSSYNSSNMKFTSTGVNFKMSGNSIIRGTAGESMAFPGTGAVLLTDGSGSTLNLAGTGAVSIAASGASLSVSATGYVSIASPSGVTLSGGPVILGGSSIVLGAPTISVGLVTVTNTCSGATTCSASCTGSLTLISGGCAGTQALNSSFPLSSTAWSCVTSVPTNLTAYAICSGLAP